MRRHQKAPSATSVWGHGRAGKALLSLVALLMLLVLPARAFAGKPVHDFFGTQGTGNGQMGAVGGVAVDQDSGDVYVVDQGNDRIQRFDASGGYLSQLGSPGSGDGQLNVSGDTFPAVGIAIDQADGSIYVADAGNNRIEKFTAAGAFASAIGTSGPGALSNPRGVAVGSDGSLYVADTNNNRIVKFDSSGAYVSDFGDEQVIEPVGVAADSTNHLYVVDGNVSFGQGRLQKFDSAGELESLLGEPGANAVTVDPTNDHVFVADSSAAGAVREFDASGNLLDTHGEVGGYLPLAVAVSNGGGPIYVTNIRGGSPENNGQYVLILEEPSIPAPTATIDPVVTFDAHSATLAGTVNPNGNVDADWRFELSSDGGANWSPVGPGGVVPEGNVAQPVGEEATGLEANTEYQVRLVASKPFVEAKSIASTSFTTNAEAAIVKALDPGPVSTTSAWLGGMVNPQNATTTYYVEYAADPGFSGAQSLPAAQDASAGSGGALALAVQRASGLQPNTVYHYRLVATNVAGTTVGESRSFRTLAADAATGLPDGRVWEKASPADKASGDVDQGNGDGGNPGGQASIDGNSVLFSSRSSFAGNETGTLNLRYVARRTSAGWSTQGINPRQGPEVGVPGTSLYQWFSGDLTKGIVSVKEGLNPGDSDDLINLYVRANAGGAFEQFSPSVFSGSGKPGFELIGASPDASHIIFRYFSDTGSPLFEWTAEGGVKDFSLLPGDPVPVAANIGTRASFGEAAGYNAISADGSRAYFQISGSGNSPVYLRENGATILVSASERDGDDPTVPHLGEFLAASKDGSIAFFTSEEPLTEDSQTAPLAADLYRWDANAPVGQRLTNLTVDGSATADVFTRKIDLGVADDGSAVYFAAKGDLTGDGDPNGVNFYLWRDGVGVRLVANSVNDADRARGSQLGAFGSFPGWGVARITPDARYLAFESAEPLVAYDTNGRNEVYLYNSETDRLTCVSCGTFGSKSKADSWFLSCQAEDPVFKCSSQQYLSRNLSTDGKRLFFDSHDALLPEDTNGVTDTYEWSSGKLYLLSSGTSGSPSRFLDASADGDDVFFTTVQQLTASDQDDLFDLYDARVGGVREPAITPPCVADECQGTPGPPPAFPSPASSSFRGRGNVVPARTRCSRKKVLRKGRCTARKARAKKRHKKASKANDNRRAGR